MTPEEQAGELYTAVNGIAEIDVLVTQERDKLARELISGKDRLEVTSFTLNGQSGSGTLRATRDEQLVILNLLLEMLSAGGRLSTRRTVPTW